MQMLFTIVRQGGVGPPKVRCELCDTELPAGMPQRRHGERHAAKGEAVLTTGPLPRYAIVEATASAGARGG